MNMVNVSKVKSVNSGAVSAAAHQPFLRFLAFSFLFIVLAVPVRAEFPGVNIPNPIGSIGGGIPGVPGLEFGTKFACCVGTYLSTVGGGGTMAWRLVLRDRALTQADAYIRCKALRADMRWGTHSCPSGDSSGGGGVVQDPGSSVICVNVNSQAGWTPVNVNRSQRVALVSVEGAWTVDRYNHAPVNPLVGHQSAELERYSKYKFDRRFLFGRLLSWNNGYTLEPYRGHAQVYPQGLYLRINDQDDSLGDNSGVIRACFRYQ